MTRYGFGIILVGLVAWGIPAIASADCLVRSPTSYSVGDNIFKDTCDTNGNKPVSLGTLLSGEDQTNNLLMTSGGAVRGTEGNLINSAVGDATSSAFTLPTGSKTITGRITGAGSVAQVIKIYGGTSSGMAAATSELLCTLTLSGTSGAAGTALMCPVITAPVLYYIAVTSGSSGTPNTILTATY